jgi:adenine-specific DNA-methyltransferase
VPNDLNTLLARVEKTDPALAAELRAQFVTLGKRREFGLNFEKHKPETVQLFGRPIRPGDKVRFVPKRGIDEKVSKDVWIVVRVTGKGAKRIASLVAEIGEETSHRAVADLVVVADFKDSIYPGFESTGELERGGDKPFHTVINGENFHALEALLFTHQDQVDAIYIDPPFNNREKTWKYNNDYVDPGDDYAHSLWLSMMERRLKLARKLLRPEDSVLIVAIDEHEVHRLALLLEQTFQGSQIQMITTVIKPGGTSRTREFSRVEEYLFFVFFGEAELVRTDDNMLAAPDDDSESQGKKKKLSESDLWEGMVRRGIGVVRSEREKQFYPIFIDAGRKAIVEWGEPLGPGVERSSVPDRPGLVTVWPIKDDLTEGFWQLGPAGLSKARERGTVRVGTFNKKTGQWRIQYMKAKKAKAVESGDVATLGKDENGVVILDLEKSSLPDLSTPRTVWNKTSHDASTGGAGLLNKVLPGRKFDYAKSLYAVEDALRFFVAEKPEAVILDFFAGSGTTAHAVMRVNRQDDGRRRSITITNNEVSDAERRALTKKGLRPGDPEWEVRGIYEHITRPRITAAVTGETGDGKPILGDYKGADEFPMSEGFQENVRFFTLTYQDAQIVGADLAFEAIAPLLWLRAGSEGRLIDKPNATFDVADTYGVLFSIDAVSGFVQEVEKAEWLRIAYVLTEDEKQFQRVASLLPAHVETVRLYESYLRTFEISTGKE